MRCDVRNDEIRDNVTRIQREWEAQRDALARCTVSTRHFPLKARSFLQGCRLTAVAGKVRNA
jgi:hypothetical protein